MHRGGAAPEAASPHRTRCALRPIAQIKLQPKKQRTRQHDGAPRNAVLEHIHEAVVGAAHVVRLQAGRLERGG